MKITSLDRLTEKEKFQAATPLFFSGIYVNSSEIYHLISSRFIGTNQTHQAFRPHKDRLPSS